MGLTIREADVSRDALALVDGVRDFASRAAYRSLFPDSDDAFIAVVGRVVTLDGMEILAADHDGRFVGAIGILYAPYLWNPDILVAEEVFWWALRGAPPRTMRRLLEGAMTRIDERKAIPMFRSLTANPSMGRIYQKFGLEPLETVFTRIP